MHDTGLSEIQYQNSTITSCISSSNLLDAYPLEIYQYRGYKYLIVKHEV